MPFELNSNIVTKIDQIKNKEIQKFLKDILNYQLERNLYDTRNPRYSVETKKIVEKYYLNYVPLEDE